MSEQRESAFPHGTTEEKLRELRDEYSDEIPKEIVSSISKPNTYKVRMVWFQSLVGTLIDGIKEGSISDPIVREEVRNFMGKVTSEEWKAKKMTSPEDISEGNRIINLVLGEG